MNGTAGVFLNLFPTVEGAMQGASTSSLNDSVIMNQWLYLKTLKTVLTLY